MRYDTDWDKGYVAKEYIHHGTPEGDIVDYQPGDELAKEHFDENGFDITQLLESDSITPARGRRVPVVQTPAGPKFTPVPDANTDPDKKSEGGE
jgi:hypothetical protein